VRFASAAAAVAIAVSVAWAGLDASATPSRPCAGTTVRYQPAKHPTLGDMPWVLAQPSAPGIFVFVVSYPQMLLDPDVNRSDGLVLWTDGARLVWNRSGILVAQRLDGPGSFRVGLNATEDGDVAEPRFPSAGCWRLSLRIGSSSVRVIARVVSLPSNLGCAATPLKNGWALPRPRSSGIRGGWPWQTTGPASLSTHGHAGDLNMKVLWSVRRKWGRSLELVGTRLDGVGSFRQEFPMALPPEGVFPSIVDVPAAGCWLFRLRTARLAGVLVVRAIDRG